MAHSLVIVESPAKAKTIEKFLGPGYQVLASYGHVRDLPSKDGSVDVGHGFIPKYVVSPKARKQLALLRQALHGADQLFLATDPDREGEAISWHLLEALGIDEHGRQPMVSRVVFHEITRAAVAEAMAHPRRISRQLVEAQQARRILDYLVGFNLSPVLWRKIKGSRSAGRVQSVALRLICEREAEIEAFVPREYWTIEATLSGRAGGSFDARLQAIDGQKLDKFAIDTAAAAEELVTTIRPLPFRIDAIAQTEKQRRPAPPFTTSTLQQEANRKLGFAARKTMSLAQRLYEGIDIGDGPVGLITYMRTDSVNLSTVAQQEARQVIEQRYGKSYLPAAPRTYQNRAKNAQEAHEAIRPTSLVRHPDEVKSALSSEEYRLYRLIWERTLASQMANAIFDATTVDILAGERYQFRASGQVVRFPGFMKAYIEGLDQESDEPEGLLPELAEQEPLTLEGLESAGHVTQPPPRYTEASLVKTLEEYGIGRPSTYAAIMNTLVERKYVRLLKRTFFPEDLGREVTRFLKQEFERYVDYDFTANMEEDLDAISRGEQQWQAFLQSFWGPFSTEVEQARGKTMNGEDLGESCPECTKPLVKKFGRKGYFIACSGYPECRYTRPLGGEKAEEPVYSEERCGKCQAPMLIKDGRFGKYLACSAYPDCKNIQPLVKPRGTGVACPACSEGELTEKKSRYGKIFFSCNRYPKCKLALWDPPQAKPCPQCGYPVTVVKTTKRAGDVQKCPQEGCSWSDPPQAKEAAGKTAKSKAVKKK